MMQRLFLPLVVGALIALPLPSAAQGAGGLSPAKLKAAGWTCFNVPDLGVHCSPPGKAFPPSGPSSQLLYFYNTTDPDSEEPGLSGAESLIRWDIFGGQPCPTEPSGLFALLSGLGLGGTDYYACHRNNKSK